MCGNGLRIAAKHLFDDTALSALQSRRSDWPALPRVFSVETLCGVKRVTLTEVDAAARFCHAVQVDMGSPVAMTELQTMRIDSSEASAALKYVAVNMGNPHCVIFVDGAGRDELRGGDRDTARGELDAQEEPLELRDFPVERIGSRVENLRSVFPNRTNVEFVVRVSKDVLAQRTFERSVGETLACGSGACATVVAAHSRGLVDARGGVWVRLRGGRLRIEWAGAASDHVFMTGAATRVFTGEVEPELLLASR
jgi:diaminopimelate epimerase